MSLHAYARLWVHLVWGTLERHPYFDKSSAVKVSRWLSEYALSKGFYVKINFVNPDHVHLLMDLPTSSSVEEIVQQLKGSSSHWINSNSLLKEKFAWGRGYGAFSVSESGLEEVCAYIADQEKHHKVRTFAEELEIFVKRYGLEWKK